MSLAELETVVVVAQEQNLRRAAKRLCISQPPLTRRIQRLESELGLEIFERSPRGMLLRPEAEVIIDQAKRILEHVRVLKTLSPRPAEGSGLTAPANP